MQAETFFEQGWCKFDHEPVLADWVEQTLPAARACVAASENAQWLRCGGTWFAGVNVLTNDATGMVPGGVVLGGRVVDFIHDELGLKDFDWEPGQVSVCYPGYPKPMVAESEAAFRYRLKRDAAHVDGLIPEGPERRRHLREHHGFLLGIPMVDAGAGAAPFVIWRGSHKLIRKAFNQRFEGLRPTEWGDVDVTELYQLTRRKIFETCERVELTARVGEAYLVHRLALHGVAPWASDAEASPDGRMIVYFRPEVGGPEGWLKAA